MQTKTRKDGRRVAQVTALMAGAACVAAFLAGCGSKDPVQDNSPDAMGSTNTTSTRSNDAGRPLAASGSTAANTTVDAGEELGMSRVRAEKMVRDYFASYNAAGQDPSRVAELDRFTIPTCRGCAGLRKDIEKRAKQGSHANGPEASLGRMEASPDGSSERWVVAIELRQNAVKVINRSGAVVESIPFSDVDRAVELSYTGSSWRIAETKKLVGGF